jgi:hypothetical protein
MSTAVPDSYAQAIGLFLLGLPPTELRSMLAEVPLCMSTLETECSTLSAEIDRATAAHSSTLLPCKGDQVAYDLATDPHFPTEYSTIAALLGRLPSTHLPELNGAQPFSMAALPPLNLPSLTITTPVSIDFLLLLHKKLCAHNLAAVFKRPVTSREAPGYDQKILFPMDLSLIRKLIMADLVTTLAHFHNVTNLMLFNCIKFNGKESEYGELTRSFGNYVTEQFEESAASVHLNPRLSDDGDEMMGGGGVGVAAIAPVPLVPAVAAVPAVPAVAAATPVPADPVAIQSSYAAAATTTTTTTTSAAPVTVVPSVIAEPVGEGEAVDEVIIDDADLMDDVVASAPAPAPAPAPVAKVAPPKRSHKRKVEVIEPPKEDSDDVNGVGGEGGGEEEKPVVVKRSHKKAPESGGTGNGSGGGSRQGGNRASKRSRR